jgi:hypothetical protein
MLCCEDVVGIAVFCCLAHIESPLVHEKAIFGLEEALCYVFIWVISFLFLTAICDIGTLSSIRSGSSSIKLISPLLLFLPLLSAFSGSYSSVPSLL